MADLDVQQAFLDGIEEVFLIMFTDRCNLLLLDLGSTQVNVYGESKTKVYKDPIPLVCKVVLSTEKGENPQFSTQVSAVITVPTKQLITNEIPHRTKEDLEFLEKACFEYDGLVFEVSKVNPKTLVADVWQMYEFTCVMPKKQTQYLAGG